MSRRGVGSRLPDLGSRGEGWVALQLMLFAAVLGAGWGGPPWPNEMQEYGSYRSRVRRRFWPFLW